MPAALSVITGPTLQERKQQLVRQAIWDAATDLFAEKGYDETTVDDIALKAGVSRRSFFRYFSSKNDLMAQGIDTYADYLTQAVNACELNSPPPDLFRQTILRVVRMCAAQPRIRKVMQIVTKYPAARIAQESRANDLHARVEAAIARRIRKSDKLPAATVAGLILSVLTVIFRLWFEHGEGDIDATAEQVLATLGHLVP
ncbi:MAG TPA: TetR/AcrR family transcriptional regulator [Bryobacteraceae bacterium]|nr:TetR/AcrR family transcriptional regulator [Bryobacteraceae bacterium]